MAVTKQSLVLWAVPRFRRPVERMTLDKGLTLANSTPAMSADAGSRRVGILKPFSENAGESPEGAGCLLACRAPRRALFRPSGTQFLPI
jgi:hypothetical protein